MLSYYAVKFDSKILLGDSLHVPCGAECAAVAFQTWTLSSQYASGGQACSPQHCHIFTHSWDFSLH